MELRDYLKVFLARKWLVLAATLVTTTAALVASLLQPRVYEARSSLLVKERNRGSNILGSMLPALSLEPERSVRTHIELIKSPALIRRAAGSVKARPGEISSALSVEVLPQTNLLHVSISHRNPTRAAKIADAVASTYAISNRNVNASEIEEARRKVHFKLRDTEEDILALQQVISGKGKRVTPELKRNAQGKLRMSLGVYQMLATKEQELRISESTEPGEVVLIQRAVVPTAPSTPKPLRNTVLGLVLGLSLGVGGAFLLEGMDTRIRSADEAGDVFGLPVLARIPLARCEKPSDAFFVTPTSASAEAEAFRALRTSLSYVNYNGEIRTILVTSGSPREGKSTISANLAGALVQAGYKVILLDCDLRNPGLHTLLELPPGPGPASVIAGQTAFESAITRHKPSGVDVVCGSLSAPPNPSELLNSRTMDELLAKSLEKAHFVILDSPPVLAVTDPVVLAAKVHGVLLSSSVGETTREEAQRVVERLSSERVRLLGVVANKVPAEQAAAYYPYYQRERKLRPKPAAQEH
ncbi:MAG: polysaccharide biosynthesis tyrosine autokinase [Actinobacteria bacterium]|nr:MAG: polysaccharide biosynthesis tyrosine autokinase [Actinomycetota bacterium]